MTDEARAIAEEAGALLAHADLHLLQGAPEQAVACARRAVGLVPGDEGAWRTLAAGAVAARRWDDLAVAMGHARARFPGAGWICEHLVVAALGQGDVDHAIRVGVAGVQAHPEDPGLWCALGLAWSERGDTDATRLALDAVRRFGGEPGQVSRLELRVCVAVGAWADAARIAAGLLAERAGDVDVLRTAVAARLAIGEFDGARGAARRLVAADAAPPLHWVLLGTAEAACGDLDAAATAQAEALARNPASPAPWQTRVGSRAPRLTKGEPKM